ncbi:MAG: hypothetical protein IJC18_03580, partial [Clostridia bacterium]|nr:hypothetical protein [Clostridia bacterium]
SIASGLLEYPQYTRPPMWRDIPVPQVLTSGHQKNIEKWKRQRALDNTLARRPDMIEKAPLTGEDMKYLASVKATKPDSDKKDSRIVANISQRAYNINISVVINAHKQD